MAEENHHEIHKIETTMEEHIIDVLKVAVGVFAGGSAALLMILPVVLTVYKMVSK